ncbi:MAG: hypothetical protein KatS3mg032_0379 [Cyclobacteriaceae bacterium]|nr:MAG: hypothetical protein KatS3mg032_0379 [Cyclobacteriaceae bacterium]
MRRRLFRYNPKTCQYEPAPFPWAGFLVYVLLFLVCTCGFFAVISRLQPVLFPTQNMAMLARQNLAYAQSIRLMKADLAEMAHLLNEFQHKEKALSEKIFGLPRKPSNVQVQARNVPEENKKILADLHRKVNTILDDVQRGEWIAMPAVAARPEWPVWWPLETSNPTIASGFGKRIHPYHKGKYFHYGIDIPAAKGHGVRSAGGGKVIRVVRSRVESGYGNYVEIDHGTGVISRYACLDEIVVRTGQQVEGGRLIGYAGISGSAVAPHLHFEILINSRPVNPMLFMVRNFTAETYARLQAEGSRINQSLD